MNIKDEVIIENDLYVVVDTHIYKDEKYYILSNGDKYILAIHKNNETEYIKDEEKVNEVLGKLGFNVSGLLFEDLRNTIYKALLHFNFIKPERKFDEEENEKIVEVYRKFLQELKDKEKNINIDIDAIINKIKKIDKYSCDIKSSTAGFYYSKIDCVGISNKYIDNDHIIIHELIHASSGLKYSITNLWFMEGATELTASKLSKSNKLREIWPHAFYVPEDVFTYIPLVNIISQIEYIINKSCSESIINADDTFLKDFEKKVGKNFYILFKHFSNYLMFMPYDYKIFEMLQNKLLTTVFDKEFESAKNIDDFEKYIVRLLKFSFFRGLKNNEDTFFEQYYLDKIEKIKNSMIKKGYKEEEVNNFLDKQESYLGNNEEQNIQDFIKMIGSSIYFDNQLPFDIFYLKQNQLNEYIFVKKSNDIALLYNKKINYIKPIMQFKYLINANKVEIILPNNEKILLERIKPELIQQIQNERELDDNIISKK